MLGFGGMFLGSGRCNDHTWLSSLPGASHPNKALWAGKTRAGICLKPKPCKMLRARDKFQIVSPRDGRDEISREDSLLGEVSTFFGPSQKRTQRAGSGTGSQEPTISNSSSKPSSTPDARTTLHKTSWSHSREKQAQNIPEGFGKGGQQAGQEGGKGTSSRALRLEIPQ